MIKKCLSVIAALTLIGCACCTEPVATKSTSQLTSLYDFQIVESISNTNINVSQLVSKLVYRDVIFVGEFHSHQASHLLQLQILEGLYQKNKNLVLSMEQFTRDSQDILNKYLSGEYGEQTLINDANAWEHYKGSYRAVVEFAREKNIPIIAANAPAMHVRCVGIHGVDILKTLPEEQKSWSAQNLDLSNEKYKAKFLDFISQAGASHGQSPEQMKQRQLKTFAAQLLRDTTMAESIILARQQYPNAQIIHLNGSFHSDGHLGTVAELEAKQPNLKVTVLSPATANNLEQPEASLEQLQLGDFVYLIKPLPQRYIDKEKRNDSIRELIKSRMTNKCEL
ncbi:ChaN family lipoprotein [uncultured Psychrosphaera sp.]|mgnify:CR=1 FL=1|uniref:ChaN family lipoprotein n=1 Tax=uncultured Psychrosphaera sp. TaxID=1403522 RepID=UPI0030F8A038